MSNIEPLDNLIAKFTKLPGVGLKTAQRYAYSIINMPKEDVTFLMMVQKTYAGTFTLTRKLRNVLATAL